MQFMYQVTPQCWLKKELKKKEKLGVIGRRRSLELEEGEGEEQQQLRERRELISTASWFASLISYYTYIAILYCRLWQAL